MRPPCCLLIVLGLSCGLWRHVGAQSIIPAYLSRRDYDTEAKQLDVDEHDQQFYSFVTRPDIEAPKWNITVHNDTKLAPGYWFMAPYSLVNQNKSDAAWVAPYIFDQHGELIWSGAATFESYNVFTFKVSIVNGTDMLTAVWPHGNAGVILGDDYEIRQTLVMGIDQAPRGKKKLNIHDFQIVNGTSALIMTKFDKLTSKKNSKTIGFEGRCFISVVGFEEWDLATSKRVFEWWSEDYIGLDESTATQDPVEDRCTGDQWDYIHGNSIAKLDDGDYLMSGRRSDALYKISHKDGSIVWRLNGKQSDFILREGVHFSGQHDARCLTQNETHMIVSFLDNAIGPGVPHTTNPWSRGLVLALHTATKPMTAELVAYYDHPLHGYAPGRGNMQTLPNGNVFLGWTDGSLHSEHTPDGSVIMEAQTLAGLKSYRNYKFPWVGRPNQPPDVHSSAMLIDGEEELTTVVHVSWNGATEVASWHVYKNANESPNGTQKIASTRRQGFETALFHSGFADYIVVHAIGHTGKTLGVSRAVRTIPSGQNMSSSVVHEAQQTQDKVEESTPSDYWLASVWINPVVAFLFGIVFCLFAILTVWGLWKVRPRKSWWRHATTSYHPLLEREMGANAQLREEDMRDRPDAVLLGEEQR